MIDPKSRPRDAHAFVWLSLSIRKLCGGCLTSNLTVSASAQVNEEVLKGLSTELMYIILE